DAVANLGELGSEGGLAEIERITSEVVAVQFDQVEGVEEYVAVIAPIANAVAGCDAVVVADDCLAVDDARPAAQMREGPSNRWKAPGEVIARTAVEPHPYAVLAGDDAEAVMLDFVNPQAARRRLVGFGWEARRDEAGRQGAHTQHNAHS